MALMALTKVWAAQMKRTSPSEALRNYKPQAGYSTARNMLIDLIIKRGGHDRYSAECLLNALWKLNDKDPAKIATAIMNIGT